MNSADKHRKRKMKFMAWHLFDFSLAGMFLNKYLCVSSHAWKSLDLSENSFINHQIKFTSAFDYGEIDEDDKISV